MKAAVIKKINNKKVLKIENVESPEILPDEVLVNVKSVGICGSDLNGFNDPHSTKRVLGLIMGHEASGVIKQIGENVNDFNIGERVAIDPQMTCGECSYCKKGLEQICDNKIIIGSNLKGFRHGAMAEYVAVKARQLYSLPDNVSFTEGAMVEPVSNAVHIFNRFAMEINDRIVIIGAGTLGLSILQVAKYKQAKEIIVIDMSEKRLNLALELGADKVINAVNQEVLSEINHITNNQGVDIVIEAVGIDVTYNQAIEIVKKRGTIIFFGAAKDSVNLKLYPILHKELRMFGSTGASREEVELSIDLIAHKIINVQAIITTELGLIDVQKGMDLLNTDKENQIKVILNI